MRPRFKKMGGNLDGSTTRVRRAGFMRNSVFCMQERVVIAAADRNAKSRIRSKKGAIDHAGFAVVQYSPFQDLHNSARRDAPRQGVQSGDESCP
jgi:hypothetical protein